MPALSFCPPTTPRSFHTPASKGTAVIWPSWTVRAHCQVQWRELGVVQTMSWPRRCAWLDGSVRGPQKDMRGDRVADREIKRSAGDGGRAHGAFVPAEAVDGRAAGRVNGRPVDDRSVRRAPAEVVRGAVPAEATGADRDHRCGDQHKDEARKRTDHACHRGLDSPGPHRSVDSCHQCRTSRASRHPSKEGQAARPSRPPGSGFGGSVRDRDVPFPAAVERGGEQGGEDDEQAEGGAVRHGGCLLGSRGTGCVANRRPARGSAPSARGARAPRTGDPSR